MLVTKRPCSYQDVRMSDAMNTTPLPRQVADAYVDALVQLDPIAGTYLEYAKATASCPTSRPPGRKLSPN